ncbi:MAG TPA: ATP-binding protein [Acetobacteraceae bacterium]|nr:ATP-binding protein [Acetobacteraceae bacterium]
MRLPPWLRSAGVRLALSYALVFGASALLLIFTLWLSTLNLLNTQVDTAINLDAQGLIEQWEDGGLPALLATIENRVLGNVDDDALYLVLDPKGRRVAGNLESLPAGIDQSGGPYQRQQRRPNGSSMARLFRYDLPAGYTLVIGRDVESRAALRTLLTQTLAWALLLIGVLSLGGALVVQHLFNRMLSHVSETAAAISAGELSRRVRLSGRGDEFDRLAATINDMLDRISRLMDGVRQVSNAIAHDLRTPITRARARLEDAAAHAESPAELRGAIERAVADLDGVTAVFQALLRISEIEAGARRSAFTALDARPLLEDLGELYGAVAEDNGVRLELQVERELPVRGDRELIQQAVANLLDNAVKFSPQGGTIRLQGGMTPEGLRITVTDQGPGIPEEELARATERFYRGETARHTPGFGLGLTLVRAVAVLHGGNLVLEDGHPGLRAVLTIPAPQEARTARLAAQGGASARAAMGAEEGRPPASTPTAPVS